MWVLTSGTKGGSTMPASRRFQLMQLKNGWNLTSRAPKRPLRHPRRTFVDLANSCWHRDLASSLNLLEYFSGSSYKYTHTHIDTANYKDIKVFVIKGKYLRVCSTLTRRSTSSRLTFSLRARNGAWPSIISYSRQPKLNQSGENVYFSLSITSGDM